jgi:hypothetical protein
MENKAFMTTTTKNTIRLCLALLFIVPLAVSIHIAFFIELILIWIARETPELTKTNTDRITQYKNELLKNSYVLKWLKFSKEE